MYVLLDFITLVLACDATITAWFYGSIFEKWQKALAGRNDLIGELFDCVLCLSYHVCFWFTVFMWLAIQLLPMPWILIPRIILYSLAATDLVHWLHGEHPLPYGLSQSNKEDK